MNNLILRTITGAVFVTVIIGSLLWNSIAFAAVFGIFTLFGLIEFYSLIKKQNHSLFSVYAVIVGFLLFAVSFITSGRFFPGDYFKTAIACILVLSLGIFIIELFRSKENPFNSIGISFLGILYIAVPFSLLVNIPQINQPENYSPGIVLGFFLIMWSNDTFAYITGMLIGKNKLYEKISPKKTWEGFFGGLVFALIVGFALSLKFDNLSLTHWLILAFIIVVTGTLGDLIESMLKRSLGCKDSGKFFPGHGGILDRFDSILISTPFVYLYLMLFLK